MDTGHGTFRPLTEKEVLELKAGELDHVFQIGETVKVKGSLFRVKAIKPKELRLKLLPWKDEQVGELQRKIAEAETAAVAAKEGKDG